MRQVCTSTRPITLCLKLLINCSYPNYAMSFVAFLNLALSIELLCSRTINPLPTAKGLSSPPASYLQHQTPTFGVSHKTNNSLVDQTHLLWFTFWSFS